MNKNINKIDDILKNNIYLTNTFIYKNKTYYYQIKYVEDGFINAYGKRDRPIAPHYVLSVNHEEIHSNELIDYINHIIHWKI